MDKFSNHVKNILHGFFLSIGTTIAEPSTVLPLIVNHFGGSSMLVGFFASLLRGGAVLIQLFAAFKSQSYARMLPYLRRVFLVRFLAWFAIGAAILLFGEHSPNVTLFCIGFGLFVFSFSAGFGAIYFKDIIGKIFSPKFRGKSMSYRQFFAGMGGLLSGALAGYLLHRFEAPQSYGYLFMISAFMMGAGYLAFSLVDEPKKEQTAQKERSFKEFLRNSLSLLKSDKELQVQLKTFFLGYGYLLSLPFIVLDAKARIGLDGVAIGSLITAQMVGAMLSNLLWARLSGEGLNRLCAQLSIMFQISALLLAFFASNLYFYLLLFFLIGAAIDGSRIASGNLILELAPPQKRPVYMALQINILSLGLFFSLIGGLILHFGSYALLYTLAMLMLLGALRFSLQLPSRSD